MAVRLPSTSGIQDLLIDESANKSDGPCSEAMLVHMAGQAHVLDDRRLVTGTRELDTCAMQEGSLWQNTIVIAFKTERSCPTHDSAECTLDLRGYSHSPPTKRCSTSSQ